MNKKVLVTSALPYVNNIPHLGNLIGSTLSADVYARHERLAGNNVLYVCGADEHGTATETKAREEGLTPEELCNKYISVHKKIYDWFNISFDVWGRTHTKTHEELTQSIFLALQKNGYIVEREVEQLFDKELGLYLADRFVEGTCPYCEKPGARGDQCDNCGKLIHAPDLINPISKLSDTIPVTKRTKHLFIDLPALRKKLDPWIAGTSSRWSHNTQQITNNWLQDLKARAITRDLSWGVPVPLDGYRDKVFYVWFDAPIGYISITAHNRDDWKDWWTDNSVELVQFMGKDNVVFHSVIFPSTLLGTGEDYNLVNTISTTEFLNMEHGKFSKSKGEGVFGDDCIRLEQEYGIPADAWRYYLLRNRPETSDTTFSFNDFQERINNELIANLANLVHRTLTFAQTNCQGITPAKLSKERDMFLGGIRASWEKIIAHLNKAEIRSALQELMAVTKQGNKFFQEEEPWNKIIEDPEEATADIQALLTVLQELAVHLYPFLPTTSDYIQGLLGTSFTKYEELGTLYEGINDLNKPTILFEKISDETIEELNKTFLGKHPIHLRTAKILAVEEHPNADKLYVLLIDLGEEERTLVAGLKNYYTKEELLNKNLVVVTNLEPATIRGVKSEGMLLAADDGTKVGVVTSDEQPGLALLINDQPGKQETISFKEFQKHKLEATKQGILIDGDVLTGAKNLRTDKAVLGTIR